MSDWYSNGMSSGTAWFSQFNRLPPPCSEWYSHLETYPRKLGEPLTIENEVIDAEETNDDK